MLPVRATHYSTDPIVSHPPRMRVKRQNTRPAKAVVAGAGTRTQRDKPGHGISRFAACSI